MAFGSIYSYPNNPRVLKVQAAGNINGLEITLLPDFQMGKTNRTPEFLSKFPLGKVPTFEGADGTTLFESDAIAQYVAESGPAASQLVGSTPLQRAVMRQWVDFADGEVMAPLIPMIIWRMGMRPYDEQVETTSLEKIERSLVFLEAHLKGRNWIASDDKASLADISMVAALHWGFAKIIDAEMRAKFPTVTAYYEKVLEVEGIKEAFASSKSFIEKREAYQG